MIIKILLFAFVAFVIGYVTAFLLFEYIKSKNCSGEIVMKDDDMYLNITKNDFDSFKDGNYVSLKIKRRNFNGFNDIT